MQDAGAYAGWGARRFCPNGCMIVHLNNNVIVSGEAFRSAENSGKPLGGRGCTSNPSGELTALPRPSSWWDGLLPSPQEPYPHSRPSVFRSCPPPILGTPLLDWGSIEAAVVPISLPQFSCDRRCLDLAVLTATKT